MWYKAVDEGGCDDADAGDTTSDSILLLVFAENGILLLLLPMLLPPMPMFLP